MTASDRIQVRVTHRFRASAERVYDAWLDPERAARFLFATESGQMVRAEVDARVGGRYLFVDRRDGDDVAHHGTYLELERPRRLVFTFHVGDEPPADHSVVTVDITARGDGCEVVLVHEMEAKWADYRDRTEAGWAGILRGLERAVEDR